MSPKSKPKRPVDIYVRVSDVRGRGEDMISTEIQEERCRAQLTALGLEAGQVFTDLDVSGRKESRPAFDALKDRVASGVSGGIAVYKLSRFGRNVKQVLTDVAWIESQGALFVCVDPTIDTSTPTGRFVLTVFAALDEMEVENIAVGWKLAQRKAVVEKGIHVSTHVPPGYRRDSDRKLAPDEQHGPTITEAFAMAARGESYSTIATFVTERGLPSAGRAITWEANRIRRMLENRVYLGEARYGEIVNKKAHEPLVDEVTWNLAQRTPVGPTLGDQTTRLLAGLCRCASCSYSMRSQAPRGSTVGTYRCRTTSPGGRCPHPSSISLARLEAYVLEQFLTRVSDVSMQQSDEQDDASEAASAAVKAEHSYREALMNTRLRQEIGAEDHSVMVAALKDEWQQALAAIPAPSRPVQKSTVDIAELVAELQRREDTKSLRELLASEIQAVFVRPAASRARNLPIGDRVRIVWADEPRLNLPKRGELFKATPYTWDEAAA